MNTSNMNIFNSQARGLNYLVAKSVSCLTVAKRLAGVTERIAYMRLNFILVVFESEAALADEVLLYRGYPRKILEERMKGFSFYYERRGWIP
jgi:hypothetical protein